MSDQLNFFKKIAPKINRSNKINNLIIESIGRTIEPDFSKTSVAHARNSVILSEVIEADIITCENDMYLAENKIYDNIICCYASPYMKYKKLINIIRQNPNAKLWWFVNDHDLEDNILLRNVMKENKERRNITMICNNERSSYRGWVLRKKLKNIDGSVYGTLNDVIKDWHTININAMIFNYEHDYNWADKTKDAIYWGTMRKWRLDDLKEYQKSSFIFSATSRTQKKLILNGIKNCQFVDKLSWQRGKEDLVRYKFSLYIEDEHTHNHYAFMANRFYESLMYNAINIFDYKCIKNIKKSGFNVPDNHIVKNSNELTKLISKLSSKENFEKALNYNQEMKRQAREEHINVKKYLKKLFYDKK